ncbi:class I SAM-dependent methyltransferase [Kitasatospora purpeofusca]|uniref:class I SAM-dependent methyltransferase n=1 Tax=Kitasatospora purpeofusca TaxID=67352 RepID=UPI00224D3EA1|nr:class I SAM-dependent methyltransferase [Kitasatospora purpeofusca]MCX4684374.1 class I SAM-dependent methyltransferase [Kitasatospora purpeofusca]
MSDDSPVHGLSGVAMTLLTPLYGRAHAQRLIPGSEFSDPQATRVLHETGFRESEVLTDRSNAVGSIHRAVVFDAITRRFAHTHPTGTVLSVGIGLCTRDQRLADTVPESVRWLGVDVPEVVELRERLLPDSRARVRAASLTSPEWTDVVEARPGPVLVLAEGVLMYLAPAEVTGFLADTRRHLGPGTRLAADFFHPWVALSGLHPIPRATGARFRSGARSSTGLAALSPGWTATAEHPVMERIGPAQRVAAVALRPLLLGHRPYAVAELTVST